MEQYANSTSQPTSPETNTDHPAGKEPLSAFALCIEGVRRTLQRPALMGWYILSTLLSGGVFLLVGVVALSLASGSDTPVLYAAPYMLLIGVPVATIIMTVATMALVYMVVHEVEVSFWQALKAMTPRLWSFLVLGFLVMLIVFTGFVAFIIPALVVGVYLVFSQIVFIKENRKGFAALSRSFQLVYGKWWGTLGRLAILFIASALLTEVVEEITEMGSVLVGTLVSIVVQAVFFMTFLHVMVLWYQERVTAIGEAPLSPVVTKRLKMAAGAGAVMLVLLPVGAVWFVLENQEWLLPLFISNVLI